MHIKEVKHISTYKTQICKKWRLWQQGSVFSFVTGEYLHLVIFWHWVVVDWSDCFTDMVYSFDFVIFVHYWLKSISDNASNINALAISILKWLIEGKNNCSSFRIKASEISDFPRRHFVDFVLKQTYFKAVIYTENKIESGKSSILFSFVKYSIYQTGTWMNLIKVCRRGRAGPKISPNERLLCWRSPSTAVISAFQRSGWK